MRLLLSWLRDFVDIDAPAEEIAEKVGLRGFEVASIESLDGPVGHDAVSYFEVQANRPDCRSRVRRAQAGETIVTLDGVRRTLDADILVIADRERAQAIAGVMGGADAEVSSSTHRVVLESAYFQPASVRRTSKRLNLKTEASAR